jgi:hypothetical protein
LSDNAREKVANWYLSNFKTSEDFTDICMERLEELFKNSDLKVEYSLSYCQGDGFNIYGEINVEDLVEYLYNEGKLNKEEKDKVIGYSQSIYVDTIELPRNLSRYSYCYANHIDIFEEWSWKLEEDGLCYETGLLEKFEEVTVGAFEKLCGEFERLGYNYFYDTDFEEIEEFCEVNEFEFYEDGGIYG